MLQQISGFLTSEECDAIRASMDITLASASTFTAANASGYQDYAETQRSSGLFIDEPNASYSWGTGGRGSRSQVFFDRTDSLVSPVRSRLATESGLSVTHQTRPLGIKYGVGHQYTRRSDFLTALTWTGTLTPEQEWYKNRISQGGQRLKTLIVFLNDGYEGGRIQFDGAGIINPVKGNAILFDVSKTENGVLVSDTDNTYADLAVTSGNKYTMHISIREDVPGV